MTSPETSTPETQGRRARATPADRPGATRDSALKRCINNGTRKTVSPGPVDQGGEDALYRALE